MPTAAANSHTLSASLRALSAWWSHRHPSLEPDPQILVFLYLVDDHPVQGPMRTVSGATEADSLAFGVYDHGLSLDRVRCHTPFVQPSDHLVIISPVYQGAHRS
jgi:hypothetical protein